MVVSVPRLLVRLKIDDPMPFLFTVLAVLGDVSQWVSSVRRTLQSQQKVYFTVVVSLGVQLLGVLVEILWVGCMSSILFFSLLAGLLRVSEEEEMNGLDLSEHEGPMPSFLVSLTPVK